MMTTEAERLAWYKRADLVKRGEWRFDYSRRWPHRWWDLTLVHGWDNERLTWCLGAILFKCYLGVRRDYAWFTPWGSFVWGTTSTGRRLGR